MDEELEKIEERQDRLADLYVKGSLPQNILEAKSEELSRQRQRLEAEHQILVGSLPKGLDLDRLAARLLKPAIRLRQWVLEASEDDMELILRALNIRIAASRRAGSDRRNRAYFIAGRGRFSHHCTNIGMYVSL